MRAYQAVCRLPQFVDLLERLGKEKEGREWEITNSVLVRLVEESYLTRLRVRHTTFFFFELTIEKS